MTTAGTVEESPSVTIEETSRLRRSLRILGWTGAFVFFLLIFTLLKLPDDRVGAYVNGQISAILSPQGISFSASQSSISVGFGISYVMKDVTLSFTGMNGAPANETKVEKISVSPSILAMITGKLGGQFRIEDGKSLLRGEVSVRGADAMIDFTAEQFDLGKWSPAIVPGISIQNQGVTFPGPDMKFGGVLSGSGSISGDFAVPSTLVGKVDLKINSFRMDGTIVTFPNSPTGLKLAQPLAISEIHAQLDIDKSKLVFESVQIGKSGGQDDIIGSVTGDMTLGRNWQSGSLNARTQFRYSDKIRNAFFLLDSILKTGQQPDGGYVFSFSGPMNALVANPPIMGMGSGMGNGQ